MLMAMENKILIKLEYGKVEIELFNDVHPNMLKEF